VTKGVHCYMTNLL